jgi:hypothetical protein
MAGVEFLGDDPCTEQEESTSNYVCQYFAVTNSSNVKEGRAKNVENLIQRLHHSFMRTIRLNVAASSNFALKIGESIKQNPLQSYKVPHHLKLPGEFEATMHMSQQKNLSLLSLQLLKNMAQQSHFAVSLKQQNGGSNSRRRQAQDVCLGNEDV